MCASKRTLKIAQHLTTTLLGVFMTHSGSCTLQCCFQNCLHESANILSNSGFSSTSSTLLSTASLHDGFSSSRWFSRQSISYRYTPPATAHLRSFFNVMCYINWRFTYLLTHVSGVSSVQDCRSGLQSLAWTHTAIPWSTQLCRRPLCSARTKHQQSGSAAGQVNNRRQPDFPGYWPTDMERSARRRDFSRIVIHLLSAT